MGGHHLILGSLTDLITGERLDDTLDERYRQKLAELLVTRCGFDVSEIVPRREIRVAAGNRQAILKIDFTATLFGKIAMTVNFGPGSLVTRMRPALAASRVLASCHVPRVVVSNGEDAEVMDGVSGKVLDSGLDAIPSRDDVVRILEDFDFHPLTPNRLEMESRIVYAYEVDGSCPCDDTICRLPES